MYQQLGANISFNMIPCANDTIVPYKIPPYVSCAGSAGEGTFIKMKDGEEQGMAHYFLTNKLELLDIDDEWHFERDAGGGGGYLFYREAAGTKPTGSRPRTLACMSNMLIRHGWFAGRFWARTLDLGLHLVNSTGALTLEGITFFATRLQTKKCKSLNLLSNRFLYPSYARRALGQYDAPQSVYIEQADNSVFSNNQFHYSEGKAIGFDGKNVTFEDNLAEWNGFHGIDGPATVKVSGGGKSRGAIVRYNTLRWCGTVSGIFSMAPDAELDHNLVERQNWGGLQHDGAGIHVTIGGQSSQFHHNWIYDGYHSLLIRFDTATSTTLDKVGKNGTLSHNVGWGGPTLVAKGDNHTVEHNTVVGTIEIVVFFGAACGMNEHSTIRSNAAMAVRSRGSCEGHGTLPVNTSNNYPPLETTLDTDICEQVSLCCHVLGMRLDVS